MKIRNVFSEIINGYNINNAVVKDEYSKTYKTLQKDSIQYTNIIDNKLVDKAFSGEIKKKFFLRPKDIIIFIKKPYRVGTLTLSFNNSEIIVPNNFIVLRDIDIDAYSYYFVANYLEKIGINKYVTENNITGNLSIEDIKEIELPNISKEKQLSISRLLNSINRRSALYSNILANDDKIINYALNKVIGDDNDWRFKKRYSKFNKKR